MLLLVVTTLVACRPDGDERGASEADTSPALAADVERLSAADSVLTDSLRRLEVERRPVLAGGAVVVIYDYAENAGADVSNGWTSGERDRVAAMASAFGFSAETRQRAPGAVRDLIYGYDWPLGRLPEAAGLILVMPGQPVATTSLAVVRGCQWRCLREAFERLAATRPVRPRSGNRTV
ncbi:MAG: hypothetical protein ACT4OZ_17710 [Gemmatimonadota bacterium]